MRSLPLLSASAARGRCFLWVFIAAQHKLGLKVNNVPSLTCLNKKTLNPIWDEGYNLVVPPSFTAALALFV